MTLATEFRRILYTIRYTVSVRKPLLFFRIIKACLMAVFTPQRVLRGVDIVLGYDCNLACKHCNVSRMKQDDAAALTLEELAKLKRDLDRLSVFSYTFTGGEPLVYPDFPEKLKLFEPHKNVIILQTNATLLTRDKLMELYELGVDIVDISIDSLDADEHDANRGSEAAFRSAFDALRWSREVGLMPVAETVASHENVRTESFQKLIEYTMKEKIILLINFAVPVGAWKDTPNIRLTEDDQLYIRELVRRYPHVRTDFQSNFFKRGCPAVNEKLYITPYGDVMGCTFLQTSFGNIREESIIEIRKRALRIPLVNQYFDRCPAAEQTAFIDRYIAQINTAGHLPVPYADLK